MYIPDGEGSGGEYKEGFTVAEKCFRLGLIINILKSKVLDPGV